MCACACAAFSSLCKRRHIYTQDANHCTRIRTLISQVMVSVMCLIHITSLQSCSSVESSYNICTSQYENLYLYILYILYFRIRASRTFCKGFTSRKNIALNFVNRHRHFIAIYIAGIDNDIFKIDKFFFSLYFIIFKYSIITNECIDYRFYYRTMENKLFIYTEIYFTL